MPCVRVWLQLKGLSIFNFVLGAGFAWPCGFRDSLWTMKLKVILALEEVGFCDLNA
jgi:hypothetical protein